MKQLHEEGRRRRAERQPHHAAARRRRRRRRRDAHACSSRACNSPFGMALVGNDLYVANTDAVVRFPYTRGRRRRSTRAGTQGRRPAGRAAQPPLDQEPHRQPRRHASSTSTVGSNSNVAENGIDEGGGPRRDLGGRSRRPARIASSPRACAIPNGMAWEPQTGALWTVVNERDELGSDLVPDYMTSVRDGALLRLAVQLLRPARRRRASSRSAPTSSPRRSCPTTRSARTPPRSGSRRRDGNALPAPFARRHVRRPARLVEPQAAQRLQGDLRAVRRRQAVGRADRRADRLRRAPTATRWAGRSASRSTSAARCSSPTTSATRSGA